VVSRVGKCLQQYERKIAAVGGIELFLGGIGPDGHIAFNEPGSSLSSRTRVKTLVRRPHGWIDLGSRSRTAAWTQAYDTIVANSRFFDNDVSKVPTMALTVGVGTVMDAREVVIVITGISKAFALYKVVEEGVNHMWTVSMVQLHKNSTIGTPSSCDYRRVLC
jgi:glucosamine-6-phosphate deaminase